MYRSAYKDSVGKHEPIVVAYSFTSLHSGARDADMMLHMNQMTRLSSSIPVVVEVEEIYGVG